MPYINIDLDEYIEEFSTSDLISELDDRKLTDSNKKELNDILNEGSNSSDLPLITLIDEIKMDVVKKGLENKKKQRNWKLFLINKLWQK